VPRPTNRSEQMSFSSTGCDFAGSYDLSRLPQIKKLEQLALGCDYGGTSWTTRHQVDAIVSSLQLESTSQLLDIGSGAGWPGLLMSRLSCCNVTLLDIPVNALAQAAARAADEDMVGRVRIVAGSATSLPFVNQAFDRVSHSDVLCCLPEKPELLQESRRVVRTGARMHFSVILPAEGLARPEYEKVLESGPPYIGVDGRYPELLREAGWQVEDYQDVTAEYQQSLQRLVDGMQDNEEELVELLGEHDLASIREHRQDQIELIGQGLSAARGFCGDRGIAEEETMSELPHCPQCHSEYAYEDGNLLVCPECAHEWSTDASECSGDERIIKDANGNVLQDGDTVLVIKDLKVKGSSSVVKVGTKVKNIRLVDGDHDIDCKVPGIGAMQLKSGLVKKA